jgi:hypothetical protein
MIMMMVSMKKHTVRNGKKKRPKVIYYTKKKRQLKPPGESRGNPLRNYIGKEEENETRKVNMKTRACFSTKKHTRDREEQEDDDDHDDRSQQNDRLEISLFFFNE